MFILITLAFKTFQWYVYRYKINIIQFENVFFPIILFERLQGLCEIKYNMSMVDAEK
jgi:hypothetical protein